MTFTAKEEADIESAVRRRAQAQMRFDQATPGTTEAFHAAREAIHAGQHLERLRIAVNAAAAERHLLEETE